MKLKKKNTSSFDEHTEFIVTFIVILFIINFYVIKEIEDGMFDYIYENGELVKCANGSVELESGWSNCIVVNGNISYVDFVSTVCAYLNFKLNSIKFDFIVKLDPSCLLLLHDEAT